MSFRENLRQIVERRDTVGGRRFSLTIQLLIVLNLAAFSIETLPDLDAVARRRLYYFEAFSVAVFTLEYLLRALAAERPIRYVFSFLGVVDLFAVLPFYLTSGVDLRTLRILRLSKLIRVLKLVRYSDALQRYRQAFALIREELLLFFGVTVALLYLSAVGIYHFEHEAQPEAFASVFHSLWWAVATLTTVGYGDVYPVTSGGRLFTCLVLLIGLGVVAAPCGMLAAALSEARRLEDHPEPERDPAE